jgi:hypothetical protein
MRKQLFLRAMFGCEECRDLKKSVRQFKARK